MTIKRITSRAVAVLLAFFIGLWSADDFAQRLNGQGVRLNGVTQSAAIAALTLDTACFNNTTGDVGLKRSATNTLAVTNCSATTYTTIGVGGVTIGVAGAFIDEAADVMALRRGTNAQALRVYETRTDASNYSRLGIQATGSTYDIYSQQAGTGVARSLRLGSNNSPSWLIDTNGHYMAVTDNTYTIGALLATRPMTVNVSSAYTIAGSVGSSCAAGIFNVATAVVTSGLITHC